jgi:hypothetical protein
MAITFDGPTKIITLSTGTTTLDVVDLYSRWKDWIAEGNANYLPAFLAVGGETIDAIAGTVIPLYAFLLNGWVIRPQAASHTLNVVGGVLLVEGGGDPFINPIGSFSVRINYQNPVQAITVATGGAAAGLTPTQATQLIDVWRRLSLDPSNPLVNTETSIAAGTALEILVERVSGSVTTTRQ